jgi:hypothetical protein
VMANLRGSKARVDAHKQNARPGRNPIGQHPRPRRRRRRALPPMRGASAGRSPRRPE